MKKNLLLLSVVLYPILSAYVVIGALDFGIVFCTLMGIALLSQNKTNKLKLPLGYSTFLLYVYFISMLFITQSFPLRLTLYTIVLAFSCTFCNYSSLIKIYKKVSVICIVVFFIQEIVRLSSGVVLYGILPFLNNVYGDYQHYMSLLEAGSSDRTASLFLEPSYFAQFLIPLLVIELLDNKNNEIKKGIILSIIILLIRSGVGIMCLGIIWAFWLIKANLSTKNKVRIFLFCGTLSVILNFISPTLFESLSNRSAEISINGADEQLPSSGFIRFYIGYYLYDALPLINKLFGASSDLLLQVQSQQNFAFMRGDNIVFLNGIQTILCYYGLIGLILFVIHLVRNFRKGDYAIKCIILTMCFMLASEAYFVSSRMMLTMVIIYCMINNKNNENIIHNQHLPHWK